MTAKEYQFMREDFLKKTLKLSDDKRIEYTEGHHELNVLWNFENIGKTLGLSPMKVLSVYLLKHTSSVFNYLKEGKTYSESIEGRISDIINYLLLLLAMIRTYKQKGEDNGHKRNDI
tara:strand:+ start:491 stop:841 length:351 start_codon:yes stop_codon:yes gene_type:complete